MTKKLQYLEKKPQVLVLMEGGKVAPGEKPSKQCPNQQQIQPPNEPTGNQIQATLVGGKHSNHCTSLLTQM